MEFTFPITPFRTFFNKECVHIPTLMLLYIFVLSILPEINSRYEMSLTGYLLLHVEPLQPSINNKLTNYLRLIITHFITVSCRNGRLRLK